MERRSSCSEEVVPVIAMMICLGASAMSASCRRPELTSCNDEMS